MPTSRPLVDGDRVVAIYPMFTLGDTYLYHRRRFVALRPEYVVLCRDFDLPERGINDWWGVVGVKVFGISDCTSSNDVRLHNAISRGTAPALYVREGDVVEPWASYYQPILARRVLVAQETKHQGLIAQLQLHGAVNIQLRVEDDVVVIRCSGRASVLEGFVAEGVRIEASPAQPTERRSTNDGDELPTYAELEQAVARLAQQRLTLAQARGLHFSQSATMNIPITISEWLPDPVEVPPPPPPPPPPPTRFNLLECDLPAADPTPAKQKHFDALAELQASFKAAKVATKTAVQPVLTRFDLLE